ncbi:unnamed protein product [Miscanthus lutarioriparius]|uniref:DUF4220 domain-containing protein n=1 Tax=Miscanthus lutarioriparius TaxID=422564 RepID=A0A811R934_9POAL|nr:unnamed protein product [Miscanthus lutarioriparius]
MFLDSVTQFWSDWGLRISVLVSLAAYALLGFLSGTRRRSAAGSLWILQWALRAILWTLYQFAEIAATSAIGNLSLRGASAGGASGEEQQLVAFWAAFLLLHLGGPDNMTAYALEDNMLSLRKTVEMAFQILGVVYAIWNYIYRGHNSRVLFAASAIVFVEGAARYMERAYALRRANLDNMQEQEPDESSKNKKPAAADGSSSSTSAGACSSSRSRSSSAAAVESTIMTYEGRALDDGAALLLAQDLFHVWRRFLVDSSVDRRSPWQRASEKLLSLPWEKMCTVAEMELSLMYEVLYTKATVAHTWPGYLIRFLSPVCSAAAASLFWVHRDRGSKGRHRHPVGASASFVGITYLLLGAAFALDVVWLLRALGSTWTYAFLKKTNKLAPRRRRRPWTWSWFRHKALCGGWWRRLHRAAVYLDLDPLRLALGVDPVAYRRWSGTIGRYNLLHECTAPRRPCRRWLATKLGLEEKRFLSELPRGVKQLVFERVQRILPTTDNPPACPDGGGAYTMVDITTCWGQVTIRRAAKLFRRPDEQPIPGREFEQDVLAWHIATCIFLSRDRVRNKIPKSSMAGGHVAAIEAMSEYLMFLVAKRRQMLPGLVLHSQLEQTRTALEQIWNNGRNRKGGGGHEHKENLAALVRWKRNEDRDWLETEGRRLVLDAAEVAGALTNASLQQRQVVQMLDLIFNVWVDKLLYAAVRCSRESHAKQLSRGGELTTMLWIVIQHAGPFRIGEQKPGYDKDSDRKRKPHEKKPEAKKDDADKNDGDKKKKEEEEELHKGPCCCSCPYPYPTPCPYSYPRSRPYPYPYPSLTLTLTHLTRTRTHHNHPDMGCPCPW